jgi:cytochrome P450
VTGARFDLDDPTLLFRDDVLDDPTGLYRQLRAEAPVWEIPGTATYVVTSAELVNEAVARIADFSSNLNSLIYRGVDGLPHTFDMTMMGEAIHVLATADPPTHTRHRKLLQPHFAPRCVATLEREGRRHARRAARRRWRRRRDAAGRSTSDARDHPRDGAADR